MPITQSDAFTFFGATGDLAYKKIFPALYAMVRRGSFQIPIIGVSRSGLTLDKLKDRAHDSIKHGVSDFDESTFAKLASLLRVCNGDYGDEKTFKQLREVIGLAKNPIHYLAIPPSMFASVVSGLKKSGCADNARVIVEKPFGREIGRAHV